MKLPETKSLLAIIGPGILVAATGVGAGDLATAGFTGNRLGVAVLWAVAAGAIFKFALNEGLARWQLATGTTVLEGALQNFGRATAWVFLPYLFLWTFFVGSALMSACGVAFHAILPVFGDAGHAKIVFGILHSLLGYALVLIGGFRLFEKIMSACIALMFLTVTLTAFMLWPGTQAVFQGLFIPNLTDLQGDGLSWTVALMGGVGGTLTILCYGYWIREKGREGANSLTICRIDLSVAYVMTAVFGLSMVIIGSQVEVDSRGALLIVNIASQLHETLGPVGKWAFLLGAWGAVFSSLLGVWQAVPYLFADFWTQSRAKPIDRSETGHPPALTASPSYRAYLTAITFIPMLGLFFSFKEIQKLYAMIGAFFMPLLAVVLLVMNTHPGWIENRFRNRWLSNAVLTMTLLFFISLIFLKK